MAASARWWDGTVGYQVYLRSFADGDGDGVGDLVGLAQRLEHLAWLGVDLVWITPCFPSPQVDHGYDVADYTDVAEQLGGLRALDEVLVRAHALGIRVLLDLVPNHTSSAHPWFRAALADRTSGYRDYYVWRDPAPDGGPPNNWVSHFGGPAWSFDEGSGQYYLHLFTPEQPDLNWGNPAVADEFDHILTFWLERGFDGFRIDVAHVLVKHPELPDLPVSRTPAESDDDLLAEFERFEHVYDRNQPEVLAIYRRWRKIADAHDALLLGEVYLLEPDELSPYVRERDGLHLAFWFAPLHLADVDPPAFADHIREALTQGAQIAPGSIAWITSSHDISRAATRLGGGQLGRVRALAVAAVQLALPGVCFLYQGEELGLTDVPVPAEDAQDPIALRTGVHARSRDPARTPMPWSPGPGLGFTTSPRPWLPLGDRAAEETVEGQRKDSGALLHRYRALVAARRSQPDDAPIEWLTVEGPVVALRRGRLVVAANLGAHDMAWAPPEGEWALVFHSRPEMGVFDGTLAPGDAVWMRRA